MGRKEYVISTDRLDYLLRTIIDAAEDGSINIKVEKDWKGNVIFYLPTPAGGKLHCIIRKREFVEENGQIKQKILSHENDFVGLDDHEVIELFTADGYTTGIMLPRSIK